MVNITVQCDGGAVMADGAEAGGGSELAGRGASLERAYVHEVYEQAGADDDAARAPAAAAFLDHLEPGSLVCDVGKYSQ